MGIIQFAIIVIVIIAVIAILWWFINKSGLTIPQPLMIVFYAIIAIIAILLLASLAGLGPWPIRWGAGP